MDINTKIYWHNYSKFNVYGELLNFISPQIVFLTYL